MTNTPPLSCGAPNGVLTGQHPERLQGWWLGPDRPQTWLRYAALDGTAAGC